MTQRTVRRKLVSVIGTLLVRRPIRINERHSIYSVIYFLCPDIDLHDMISAHGRVLDEKNRTSLQILYSLRQGKENESANPVQFPKQEDLNTFTLLSQDPDSNFEVRFTTGRTTSAERIVKSSNRR